MTTARQINTYNSWVMAMVSDFIALKCTSMYNNNIK